MFIIDSIRGFASGIRKEKKRIRREKNNPRNWSPAKKYMVGFLWGVKQEYRRQNFYIPPWFKLMLASWVILTYVIFSQWMQLHGYTWGTLYKIFT